MAAAVAEVFCGMKIGAMIEVTDLTPLRLNRVLLGDVCE
jgi:hypothetical protein